MLYFFFKRINGLNVEMDMNQFQGATPIELSILGIAGEKPDVIPRDIIDRLQVPGSTLSIAKRRLGEKVDLRKGDSEKLPWESNTFDMIICTDSFHHYPKPGAVLAEMKRVLKPEGKIIIAAPWLPTPLRQISNLFIPFGKDGDVKIYSHKDMVKLSADCKLRPITWKKAGKVHFYQCLDGRILTTPGHTIDSI